jgi:hypothetical protein
VLLIWVTTRQKHKKKNLFSASQTLKPVFKVNRTFTFHILLFHHGKKLQRRKRSNKKKKKKAVPVCPQPHPPSHKCINHPGRESENVDQGVFSCTQTPNNKKSISCNNRGSIILLSMHEAFSKKLQTTS